MHDMMNPGALAAARAQEIADTFHSDQENSISKSNCNHLLGRNPWTSLGLLAELLVRRAQIRGAES
jgi:hypothetical protein